MTNHSQATTPWEASSLIVADTRWRQEQAGRKVVEDTYFPGFFLVLDDRGTCGYIHQSPTGQIDISISPPD